MGKVRTRFAPSPTGRMHVGNLRNGVILQYLIAKHEEEISFFVLRILTEERLVEGAVDIIYRTLKATGLKHDEGPGQRWRRWSVCTE